MPWPRKGRWGGQLSIAIPPPLRLLFSAILPAHNLMTDSDSDVIDRRAQARLEEWGGAKQ